MDMDNYILNDTWNIWYHHSLNMWTIDGYRNIFSIKTIKDFWDFHNNIECLGGINNVHFFLMKNDIKPIWEDNNNRNGGCWSTLVPLDESYNIWEKLAVDMISNQFGKSINGISINQKNNVSIIKIWNSDKNLKDNIKIPDYIRKYGNVIYRPHKVNSNNVS